MLKQHIPFISLLATFVLNGCTTNLVDIKDRAIFSVTHDPQRDQGFQQVVCAEPSPDALSAYAGELFANLEDSEDIAAGIGAAFRESAAYVGLRTPSIQLLRDSMYRICESYMNQAINEAQFEILMRRSQKYMVALMAIEQMTGAIKAPPVTVNTSGRADIATTLTEIVNQQEEAQKEVEGIEAEISDLNKQLAATNTELAAAKLALKTKNAGLDDDQKIDESEDEAVQAASEKVEEATKAIEQAQKRLASRASLRDTLNSAIAAAKSSVLGGETSATIMVTPAAPPPSDKVLKHANDKISTLVASVVNSDDMGPVCLSYAASLTSTTKTVTGNSTLDSKTLTTSSVESSEPLLKKICDDYLSSLNELHKAKAACVNAAISQGSTQERLNMLEACRMTIKSEDLGVKRFEG